MLHLKQWISAGWIVCWLFLGVGLRGYNLGAYPFGFDQVQILTAAEAIRSGDLTLIGPRTGPAALFTGPLIYYLAAVIGMVMDPIAGMGVLAVGLAGVTGLTMYLLGRRYLGGELAEWILPVWALSPFLISLDRVTWNPNLMVLAASLVLFPLLTNKQWGWREVLTMSAGVGLGYQAHFSGLLLLPLCLLGMGLHYRGSKWPMHWFLLPVLAWGLSLTPTIWFDVRNDWLNWRGLTQLLTNSDQVSLYMIAGRLGHTLFVIAESMGKVWWYTNQTLWVTAAGIAGLVIGMRMIGDQSRRQAGLMMVWLMGLAVALALYRESTPEYYFLLGMPVWLILWSVILKHTLNRYQWWVGIVLISFALMSTYQLYAPEKVTTLSLGNQQAVVGEMKSLIDTLPVVAISWDMAQVETIGLKYLFDQNKPELKKFGADLHVIYPLKSTDYYTRKPAPMVGLWVDIRDKLSSMSIPIYPFLIYVPSNLTVLEEMHSVDGIDRQWRIENERGERIGSLKLIIKMNEEQKLEWDKSLWDETTMSGWQRTEINNMGGYFHRYRDSRLELISDVKIVADIKVVDPGSMELILNP